jgi:uncharacterized membrane protein YjjP (DUF1212 family)
MEYDINQILFYTGLIVFAFFSFLKEKKRKTQYIEITSRINDLQTDLEMVARNPQLARRKLKNK